MDIQQINYYFYCCNCLVLGPCTTIIIIINKTIPLDRNLIDWNIPLSVGPHGQRGLMGPARARVSPGMQIDAALLGCRVRPNDLALRAEGVVVAVPHGLNITGGQHSRAQYSLFIQWDTFVCVWRPKFASFGWLGFDGRLGFSFGG